MTDPTNLVIIQSMAERGMVKKAEFPYPCEDVPRFKTQHKAAVFIENFQAKEHIKRCSHVTVGTIGSGIISHDYRPICAKDSFEDRTEGREVLFYGCPSDCRLYEPAWKGKTVVWCRNAWRPMRRGMIGVGNWFASLSGATQAILAVGIVALLNQPWRATIVEILKIIFPPK